jgi:LysM repeat protein
MEVVVREQESLAQVAERALGDRRGASELKALNGLTADSVPAGTTLKLPGPDRTMAQAALAAARSAVAQAGPDATRRTEAVAKVTEAEGHFQAARYKEAAQAADGAWRLVSAHSTKPTSFAVAVSDTGATTVTVHAGAPVRVEAEGVSRPVYQGQQVRVEKGQPPPPPPPPLAVPEPTLPADGDQVTPRVVKGQPQPVVLTWGAVAGARAYEVELVPVAGEPRVHRVTEALVRLEALKPGRYHWSVRAVGEEGRSEPSAPRAFEVVEAALQLKVKGSSWK